MNKDRVIVRITEWGKNKKPQGEVVQVMDEADENDRAMKEILMENGFPFFFRKKYWKNLPHCRIPFPQQIWKQKRFPENTHLYD